MKTVSSGDRHGASGFDTEVLNVHTVKPIDAEALLEIAGRVRGILVVEEHSVHCGLGSALLEILDGGQTCPVRRIGIGDLDPPIGPTPELRQALGFCAENIVAEARALLVRPSAG